MKKKGPGQLAKYTECIQQLSIADMDCSLYLPPDYEQGSSRYPVIYVNGEIAVEKILTELVKSGVKTDFLLLSVKPASWNDDFTPWSAPAFCREEQAPQGRADVYLAKLIGEIKPYMDANFRTKPEPQDTALFGYSLGGLTAVYAIYMTDVFGAVGSLSGSLWYDGFCEYMESREPLRRDVRVYFSLGKKESASRNPRMGMVADCTERAYRSLKNMDVSFEWNDGGHFHEIEQRFVRAFAWWVEGGCKDALSYPSRPYRADS